MPLFQNESSYDNEFYLHETESVHFHINGFAETCFDSEAKATQKWSIGSYEPCLISQEVFFSIVHAPRHLRPKLANKKRLGITTPETQ